MTKILFVCLGNICRSPMAKFIFIDMLKRQGIQNEFVVDSAATSSEEEGNGLYYKARKKLEEENIDCIGHIAKQMKSKDYKEYDYIIGMEDRNISNILRIVGKDNSNKIYKLLDFVSDVRDISDPWYTGDFDKAYKDIQEGCKGLLDYLLKNR